MGERRIGVALSDPGGVIAFPQAIIQRQADDRDTEEVAGLVAELDAGGVVVGLPRSLSGGTGPQAEKVLAFTAVLKEKLGVPVHTYDERLSTVVAERRLRETGKGGRKGRGAPKRYLDADAAAIILQGYLDRQKASP